MLKKDVNINPISATVAFNNILFTTNLRICLGKNILSLDLIIFKEYYSTKVSFLVFIIFALNKAHVVKLVDMPS